MVDGETKTEEMPKGEVNTTEMKPTPRVLKNKEIETLKSKVGDILNSKEWSVSKLRKISALVGK